MCGFVATISKDKHPFHQDKLREMTTMISHRGPDDEGFFFSDRVSLGFRRLKIIDLSERGHQPMFSDNGRHVIVFNGEIYNYCEIRKDLEINGILFKSDSDTEVLLKSFIFWGEKCLSKFIGMFAFVICDLQEGIVYFARDQLGIKPLFLYEDSNYFILTSEIKALLPYTSLEPAPETFNEYLVFRSLPGERTMFKGVKSIPAASFGTLKNNTIYLSRYFKIEETFNERKINFQDACSETEKMLRETVALHLRSDVELGIQLSGGVDSSLITAIASDINGRRMHSFSISFNEPEYDESKYQQRVSSKYNTEHHDFRMDDATFVSNFEKAIWHYEHPLNDPNSVATYHLAVKSKKIITVMLSGEGADESFLGYTKFLPNILRKIRLRNLLYQHPRLRSLIEFFWPFHKGYQLLRDTKYPPAMLALSYAKPQIIDDLLQGRYIEMEPRSLINKLSSGNHIKEVILQDEICDLSQWLWRADRMGMATSLEFRVPFCTPQIFSLANSIPYKIKTMQGERKAILKKVAEKYFDRDQIYRKKNGFGLPIKKWLDKNGPYREFFEDTMNSIGTKDIYLINHSHFKKLYSDYRSGKYKEVNSAFLWTYLNMGLWFRIFFDGKWKMLSQ